MPWRCRCGRHWGSSEDRREPVQAWALEVFRHWTCKLRLSRGRSAASGASAMVKSAILNPGVSCDADHRDWGSSKQRHQLPMFRVCKLLEHSWSKACNPVRHCKRWLWWSFGQQGPPNFPGHTVCFSKLKHSSGLGGRYSCPMEA